MKQIIVVKTGTLPQKAIDKLEKEEDFLIIEHPEPNEIRVITFLDTVEGNDIMMALIKAVYAGNKGEFFYYIANKIVEKNKAAKDKEQTPTT